jgi:signal transduction histidine kinase
MQKAFTRLENLNSIGEMAASIGHEVRNPLTTVRGFLQFIANRPGFSNYKDRFDLMISELDRANAILTDFLSLAKYKTFQLELNNLNSIVKAILPLLNANAIISGYTISLELGDIPKICADEKEIRQLILNLCRNGLEAMPPGGKLIIKTFKDNNDVVLSIKDHGPGIPQEILEKIGVPFFTTKESGTGLGLAVCYSIALRHNAKIDISTNTGGTTVSVKFPESQEN